MKQDNNDNKVDSSFLSKLPKDTPFEVPEDYFDTFTDRLFDKIDTDCNEVQKLDFDADNNDKIVPLYKMIKPGLMFAASFIGIAVMIYFPLQYVSLKADRNSSVATADYSDSLSTEVERLFAYCVDSYELEDMVNKQDSAVSQSEMEEYLVSQMDQFELLVDNKDFFEK